MENRPIMWLTINRNCNMRCKWCYASTTGFSSAQTMDLEFAKKALVFAKDMGVERVVIIGGEPLIHPKIVEIVEACSNQGLKSSIVTNGIRYADQSFLKRLIDAGLGATSISLKAITRKKYKEATGVDKFDDFLSGFMNVKESGLNHQISFTLTEYFDESVDDLVKLLNDLSPKNIFIDTERPELNEDGTHFVGGNNINLLARKFEEVYLKIRETRLNYGVGCYMPLCKIRPDVLKLLIDEKKMGFGCHLITGANIIMEPDGSLIPCNHMCGLSLIQFGKDFSTAEEYLKFKSGEQYVSLLKKMRCAPDVRCVDCKLWPICGGSCRLRWMLKDNPLD